MTTVYTFGACTLCPGKRSLVRGGREVALQPKVFDLLVLLIRYRDQVLEKAELRAALWPSLSISDAALTRLVKEGRRAIGDDGARQEAIRTVQRRGYRFVADVRVEHRAEDDALAHGAVAAARSQAYEDGTRDAQAAYLRAISMLRDGRREDAPLLCEALLALAELSADGGCAPDPEIAARAQRVSHAHGLWDAYARALLARPRSDLDEHDASYVDMLQEALGRTEEASLRARLRARLAQALSFDPCRNDAASPRAEVLSQLDALSDRDRLEVLDPRHDWVLSGLAPSQRGRVVSSLCRDEGTRSLTQALDAQLLSLRELLAVGDRDGYRDAFERFVARAERAPRHLYRVLRLDVARAIAAGEFARAEESMRRCAQLPSGLPLREVWGDHDAQDTSLRAAREQLDDVRPARARDQSSLSVRAIQLWLSACTAEHAQARLELRRLLPAGDLTRLHPADAAIVAASCALLSEPLPGGQLEQALSAQRGRNVLRGELVCYGPCDYFLGVLAELKGDLDGAREAFAAAETLAARSGLTLSLIRVRLHAARVSPDPAAKRAFSVQAAQDAERLGLSQAASYARSLLER